MEAKFQIPTFRGEEESSQPLVQPEATAAAESKVQEESSLIQPQTHTLVQSHRDLPQSSDSAILHQFLRSSPADAARQLVDQLKNLELQEVSVTDLQLFKLAEALGIAPISLKQELATHLAQGFADIAGWERAELTRLVLRIVAAFRNREFIAKCARVKTDGQEAFEALQDPSHLSAGELATHAETLKRAKDFMHSQRHSSPFLRNLLELMSEAGLSLPNPREPGVYKECVISGARTLLKLGLLRFLHIGCELVIELDKEERQQLINVMVERNDLGTVEQHVLKNVVQPGGYADKCAYLLSFVSKWCAVCCTLPFFELFLSLILGSGVALVTWLCADSILWILTVVAVYLLKQSADRLLLEGFEEALEDDNQSSSEHASLTYKLKIACAVIFSFVVVFLVAGAVAGLIAAIELVFGFFSYGSIADWVFCAAFDAWRLVATYYLGYAVHLTLLEVYLARNPTLASQESDKIAGYGAML